MSFHQTFREMVTYVASCPGCGQDARWRTERHREGTQDLVRVDFTCTGKTCESRPGARLREV